MAHSPRTYNRDAVFATWQSLGRMKSKLKGAEIGIYPTPYLSLSLTHSLSLSPAYLGWDRRTLSAQAQIGSADEAVPRHKATHRRGEEEDGASDADRSLLARGGEVRDRRRQHRVRDHAVRADSAVPTAHATVPTTWQFGEEPQHSRLYC